MPGIILVVDGRSQYAICLAADSEPARFAAEELRDYIDRLSGARIDITFGDPGEKSILLRQNRGSTDPGAGHDDDAYRIEITESGAIEIAGATAFALLHGVYAFLELAGCRWFAPDYDFYGSAGGSEVPRLDVLEIQAGRHARSPSFRNRKKYIEEARSHTPESIRALVDWMPRVGLNVLNFPTDCFHEGNAVWDDHRDDLIPELRKRGIRLEVGGHGFENFITDEVLAEHPDWAGMRPDGERELRHGKRTFCTSNAEAMAFFTPAVMKYVGERPEIDVFSLWPPDTTEWCICEDCTRLGPIEYRNALVINEVARAAKSEHPDLTISFAAYFEPTRPPRGLVLEDNVAVDFCPITRSYDRRIYDPASRINRQYHDLLLDWFESPSFGGELNIYTYYRKYAWRSLPILLPGLITDELRHYASLGVAGIGSYSEAGDWWTYELQHYVIAKLSFDAGTSLDDLLDDYFTHRYGSAGPHIRDLVRLLEGFMPQVARIPGTVLGGRPQPASIYEFFRPSRDLMRGFERLVARCRALLQRARDSEGHTAEVAGRLDKWAVLIDYAGLEVEARGQALALADRATGGYLKNYVDIMRRMGELARANSDNGLIVYPRWAEYDAEIRDAMAAAHEPNAHGDQSEGPA